MEAGTCLANRDALLGDLITVFDRQSAEVLLDVLVKASFQMSNGYATRDDVVQLNRSFDRLTDAQRQTDGSLKELAEAQKKTDHSIEMLAEAQKKTDHSVEMLAEAQKKTDHSIEMLAEAQKKTDHSVLMLAEAQHGTEQRLTRVESAVERLAEAQRRSGERLDRVESAVERLAEAQRRSGERLDRVESAVERLGEAQSRTDESVKLLAEAQGRTERSLDRLAKQVGGLSETVGGDIEDIAYIVIHDVLKREWDWDVDELERSMQVWGGREVEIDVFGKATDPSRPDQTIWIVGEAKHNLSVSEVERFTRVVEDARKNLQGEIIPICFCYRARPVVQQTVKDAGYRLVFSYGKLV